MSLIFLAYIRSEVSSIGNQSRRRIGLVPAQISHGNKSKDATIRMPLLLGNVVTTKHNNAYYV
jgi:hypothetical protein